MQRQAVSSSNLRSVGYDLSSQTLEIEFKDGSVYQYFGVPQSVYSGLMSASSVGSYLAAQIKSTYRYARV